ncbi:methyltransferase domain-containing protein [Sphingobium sufflavum]|uniref:class I SAM-dependent methyltransferase n=1 Tax=Sphingobium sufflavum TaxID=1129547 RepID=UPI001F1E3FBC|nr:class I SAM-dependent methyltransferase [Sphingobium sufflavum]MCE7797470.1 methyltransferase domain-containing protein [Sphingobium sufflavum]
MPLGSTVRAMFGPHERRVSDLYRGLFLDLDDYAAKIAGWSPGARKILEVGCGEGAVTEVLARIFPQADILGIDITPRVGRLYDGPRDRVEFRVAAVQDVARDHPGAFDLIILSDVMHHIPVALRAEIVGAIGQALAPGGRFILKDWGKAATPIHWLCHAGDRWLTGDRVSHLVPDQAKSLILDRLPALRCVEEGHIAPWTNNYTLVFAA